MNIDHLNKATEEYKEEKQYNKLKMTLGGQQMRKKLMQSHIRGILSEISILKEYLGTAWNNKLRYYNFNHFKRHKFMQEFNSMAAVETCIRLVRIELDEEEDNEDDDDWTLHFDRDI